MAEVTVGCAFISHVYQILWLGEINIALRSVSVEMLVLLCGFTYVVYKEKPFMQGNCVSKDEADTGLSVLIVPLTTQQLPHIVALAVGLKCITHTLKSGVIIKNLSVSVPLPSILPVFNHFSFICFRSKQANRCSLLLVKTNITFSIFLCPPFM